MPAKSSNPWVLHVMRYQRSHPSLSYGECLKKARASYKPVGGARVAGARKKVKRARAPARRRRAGMY